MDDVLREDGDVNISVTLNREYTRGPYEGLRDLGRRRREAREGEVELELELTPPFLSRAALLTRRPTLLHSIQNPADNPEESTESYR